MSWLMIALPIQPPPSPTTQCSVGSLEPIIDTDDLNNIPTPNIAKKRNPHDKDWLTDIII